MRRYYIKTYGCQMNVADSAKLEEVLQSAGYTSVDNEEKTDVVLVNTCVVRQNAEDRAAGFIRSLSGTKERNPNLLIGVCGCYVTEPGRDLKKQFPHVDLFIPPNSPHKLFEYLNINSEFGIPHSALNPWHLQEGTTFVTIMTGCDNYCSYCIVPYVRGRETSRPMDEVLAEIKSLIEQGVTDITLLGQNVNSYEYGLANLMKKIHSFYILHFKFLIRFMTSHPKDMSDEIIEAVRDLPCVAKEFHLPLQSGDNEILKKMNRGYTVEYFKDRIAKIRFLIPQARITSDMLVGFPGETEEQFNNSLKLIEELKFDAVNMFAFSARPETAAAKMPDQLSEEIKYERLQKLIALVRKNVSAILIRNQTS
jgi:tRNA-2-methylthio-N6-dimethylallyladenosine synthase